MHFMMQSARLMAIGLSALTWTSPSFAGTWPQQTVRVIVPNPPGVGLDIIARVLAEKLGSRWKQSVIIENRPGADGIVAARDFAAKRDPHTLLYSFSGLITINPLIHSKLPYDPGRDLVPITSVSENGLAIAVPTTLKIASIGELVQLARARPNELNWAATPGVPYFVFAGLQKAAGINMVQVSYRSFLQAIGDLTEGRIHAVAAGLAPLLPQVQAGKVRLLAFINRDRIAVAPDIPTIAEAGYPDFSLSGASGFFGWRDMPSDLRERIAADVREIVADPTIKQRLAKIGSTARGSTPAEYAAAIEEIRAKLAKLARVIGTTPTP